MLNRHFCNPTPLYDKVCWDIRDIRNISKHNKNNIQQADSQHQIKLWQTKSDSTKIRNKQCCTLYPHLFNIVFKVLAKAIRQQRKIKKKKKSNFCWQTIYVYVSDSKNSWGSSYMNDNSFSNVTWYKINFRNISGTPIYKW